MKEESGFRRTFWLSKELDSKVEELRKTLGLSRSGFYRFAVIETLKSFLTAKQQLNLKKRRLTKNKQKGEKG